MLENVTLCKLFLRKSDGECVHTISDGGEGEINIPHCNPNSTIDFDKYKYFEKEQEDGSIRCELWQQSAFDSNSIILPVIIFVLLCLLLLVMIYQNV